MTYGFNWKLFFQQREPAGQNRSVKLRKKGKQHERSIWFDHKHSSVLMLQKAKVDHNHLKSRTSLPLQ